ncbi:hypothetical protein [Bacteroides sp. 224]|uniref:hypothetical protein n=1 Tax=Bacteroides sp. 224 TaxID=2302936 RepID=UPI0013D25402|nr:hypothetical protein [Bacteroides sp. 224]NDV65829.1 hypothetical protein [Bacteroides sp. 224]
MKKLYIPTTTLNFNNILSSESISPKSFYEKRGFGYSRWFSIPENNFDNIILLYESLCSFDRPKSDYEDHPLLIEVYLPQETASSLTQLEERVYCCDHTVYLTPWNTRFLFFSNEDKRITLSMSDSSLETKLLKLYSKRFSVENSQKKYDKISFSDTVKINLSEVEKDIRINKMKGLLYGYYIGALLSTSSESVKQLNVLREIFNIFAAILSSLDKIPTDYQENKLDSLLNELRKTDSFYITLLSIIDDVNKTDQVISAIKSEYGFLKNDLDIRRLLNDLRFNKEQTDVKNASIIWIENKIFQQEEKIRNEYQPLSTEKSEIVIVNNKLSFVSDSIIKDKTENELFKHWINDLFSSKDYNGKISSFKERISDDATTEAKEVYQEKWVDSYAKEFLNKLRRHVRGDEFGLTWDNGVFSSIAAVITNGGEWAKLLTFMQSKGMYDYRLAFAMFGVLNGFANLTRDFTDIIYSCDSNYIAEIYKEFHGQLFGNNPVIESVKQKNDEIIKKDNDKIISIKTIEDINDSEILSFINYLIVKCKSAERDKHVYEKLFREHGMSYGLLQAIKDNKVLNKGKGVRKNVIKFIEKEIKSKSNNIFASQPIKNKFYLDESVFDRIEYLLSKEKKERNKIKTEIDWIQKVHKDGGYQKKSGDWIKLNDHSNQAVIKHFENNAKDRIEPTLLVKIVGKLKELYLRDE